VAEPIKPKLEPSEVSPQTEPSDTAHSVDILAEPPAAVNGPISNLPRQVDAPNANDANQTMPKRDISTFNN